MNDASEARNSGKGSYDATGRSAVDLDELERQLRQMASSRPATNGSDPLAELARLVDQADPFSQARQDRQAAAAQAAGTPHFLQNGDGMAALERAIQSGPQLSAPRVSEQAFAASPAAPRIAEQSQTSHEAHASPAHDMQPARDALEAFLRRAPEPQRNDPFAGHVVDTAFERPPPQVAEAFTPPRPASPDQPQSYQTPSYDGDSHEPAPYQPAAYDTAAFRATVSTAPADQSYHPQPEYAEPEYAEPDYSQFDQRRSRKGLVTVASVLGVGALGLALALSLRGGEPKVPSGEPPVVRAESGPARVQPANPGGVDIPNQNKQIYERAAAGTPGQSNVVNNSEQPVDLNQAVRNVAPRVVLPGGIPAAGGPASAPAAQSQAGQSQAGQSPAGQSQAGQSSAASQPGVFAAVLGEPKRVKTVSVRPDGTIVSSTEVSLQSSAAPASSLVQPRPASISGATPSATSAVKPVVLQQSAPSPAPVATAPRATRPDTGGDLSSAAFAASAPLSISPLPDTSLPKSQQRINTAAVTSSSVPAVAAPTTVARAPSAALVPAPLVVAPAATGGGDFAVQLAAPGSEKEARDLFASLQRRFPGDLGGISPTIRRAEVGDRTIYRLRVGSMERAGAVALCERLKASGGQCFVARN